MKKHYWVLATTTIVILAGASLASNNNGPVADYNFSQRTLEAPLLQPIQHNQPAATVTQINLTVNAEADAKGSTASAIDQFREMTASTDLQRAVVEEYDNYQRYPPTNRRIELINQDPISQRYATDERSTIDKDSGVGMTIWSNEKYYLPGDQVEIFAFLQNPEGERIDGDFDALFIAAEQGNKISSFRFNDDDSDLLYSATLNLSSQLSPGIYKVLITDKLSKITDSMTFTLSRPNISATGKYRDTVGSTGELLIEMEVDVAKANNFYVQATLYADNTTPIGVSEHSQRLSTGRHWLPLSFAGRMLRDAGAQGPYLLKQVSLAKVTMPMQRAPLLMPGYHTEFYSLDDFSN